MPPSSFKRRHRGRNVPTSVPVPGYRINTVHRNFLPGYAVSTGMLVTACIPVPGYPGPGFTGTTRVSPQTTTKLKNGFVLSATDWG
eukprot:3872210-Rhodomonas_salina.1